MDIYYLPLNCNNWDSEDIYLLSFLTPDRKAKIYKYINASDKKLSLYAALATRMVLASKTGCLANVLDFITDDNHKPKLATNSTIDFNFSHTSGAILLTVSNRNLVGADIELCRTIPEEVIPYVFHPQEISYINAATDTGRTDRFYEIWTKKEAYTKMQGLGLSYDILSLNVLSDTIKDLFYTWKQGNYMCSVCSNTISPTRILHTLSEQTIKDYFMGH